MLTAAVLADAQSLALLAVGLTGLDWVLGTAVRPSGALVAVTLALLATWVVLGAGGGASLADGAGRRLFTSVACAEIVLLLVLAAAGARGADGVRVVTVGALGALPVPALALFALTVPSVKLLLAGAPSAEAWVAAGPRPRRPRPAPEPGRPVLRAGTLSVIGLALTTVALVGSPAGPATAPTTAPATAVVGTAP